MFCPQCGCEYREGFEKCADCDVALVPHPPALSRDVAEYVEFVEVLQTMSAGDVALICSELDAVEVKYYFHGGNFTSLDTLVAAHRLWVAKSDVPLAFDVLRGLSLEYSISPSQPPETT